MRYSKGNPTPFPEFKPHTGALLLQQGPCTAPGLLGTASPPPADPGPDCGCSEREQPELSQEWAWKIQGEAFAPNSGSHVSPQPLLKDKPPKAPCPAQGRGHSLPQGHSRCRFPRKRCSAEGILLFHPSKHSSAPRCSTLWLDITKYSCMAKLILSTTK